MSDKTMFQKGRDKNSKKGNSIVAKGSKANILYFLFILVIELTNSMPPEVLIKVAPSLSIPNIPSISVWTPNSTAGGIR